MNNKQKGAISGIDILMWSFTFIFILVMTLFINEQIALNKAKTPQEIKELCVRYENVSLQNIPMKCLKLLNNI